VTDHGLLLKKKLFPYANRRCLEAIDFDTRDGAFPDRPFETTPHYKVIFIFRLLAADVA
jgi:hypothetical protein